MVFSFVAFYAILSYHCYKWFNNPSSTIQEYHEHSQLVTKTKSTGEEIARASFIFNQPTTVLSSHLQWASSHSCQLPGYRTEGQEGENTYIQMEMQTADSCFMGLISVGGVTPGI